MKKYLKKNLAAIILAVMLSSFIPNLNSIAAEPSFTMNITGTTDSEITVNAGEVFSIDVNYANKADNMDTLALIVAFDSNQLAASGRTANSDIAPNGVAMANNTTLPDGRSGIIFAFNEPGGEIGEGLLCTLKFKLKENVTGPTNVEITSIKMAQGDSDEVAYTPANSITVKGIVAMNGLIIDNPPATMNKGQIITLNAKKQPDNTSDTSSITWSSSNETIATVVDGKVNAVGIGSVKITAECNGYKAECDITVNNPMTGISLNKSSLSLNKGKSETIIATRIPGDTTDSSVPITFSSDNSGVATVEENTGKITAVSNGKATITATCGSFTAKCVVQVETPLTDLIIDKATANVIKGETIQLNVTKNPVETTNTDPIIWKSSDEAIATVDENGVVTGVKSGKVTITATCGSFSVSSVVEVLVHIESIEIKNGEEGKLTLKKGQSEELNVVFNPDETTDSKTLDISIDNEDILGKTGMTIVAKNPGTATVTVTSSNGKIDTITVTVPEIKATELVLNKNITQIEKGESETLTATVLPEDTTDSLDIEWSIEEGGEDIISVDNTGKVTAKKPGTTNVIAKSGSFEAKCEVTVTSQLKAIVLDRNNITLEPTQSSEKLIVTINPSDATVDASTITWESTEPSVATVVDGVITAVAPGTTNIIAKLAGKTASCAVKVIVPLTGVELDGEGEILLYRTYKEKLNVKYTPENATEIPVARWSSSDESVAKVDANGVVEGLKEGKTTITVDYGNDLKAEKVVKVEDIKAESIVLIPENIQINVDKDENKSIVILKNTDTPIKYEINPVNTTEEVFWTSSDENIVKVVAGESGVAGAARKAFLKAIAPGKASVTIKVGNLTDTLEVEVKEIPITALKISLEKSVLEEQEKTKVNVTYEPENTTDEKVFTYTSSNESVATVDSNGVITAKKAGTTFISVKAKNGVSSSVKLVVIEKIEQDTSGETNSPISGTENNQNAGNGNNSGNSGTPSNVNPQPIQTTVVNLVNGMTTSPHTGDMNVGALLLLMISSLVGIAIILKKK